MLNYAMVSTLVNFIVDLESLNTLAKYVGEPVVVIPDYFNNYHVVSIWSDHFPEMDPILRVEIAVDNKTNEQFVNPKVLVSKEEWYSFWIRKFQMEINELEDRQDDLYDYIDHYYDDIPLAFEKWIEDSSKYPGKDALQSAYEAEDFEGLLKNPWAWPMKETSWTKLCKELIKLRMEVDEIENKVRFNEYMLRTCKTYIAL